MVRSGNELEPRPGPGDQDVFSEVAPALDAWADRAALDAALGFSDAPVQRREGDLAKDDDPGDAYTHEVAAGGVTSSGTQLPHLDLIQASFGGHDVTDTRAHIGGDTTAACDALGAEAYATGNDVAFCGSPDLHTAAHEAAHVVQQRQGVQLAGGVGQAGDRYERQADAVADAVVAGNSAEALLGSRTGSVGASVLQRQEVAETADGEQPSPPLEYVAEETPSGETLSMTPSVDADAEQPAPLSNIQAISRAQTKAVSSPPRAVQMEGGNKRKHKTVYVPYQIRVTREMSRDEFRVLAMTQIFGGVIDNVVWRNGKVRYTPDGSPYPVSVDTRLLSKYRGNANAARGFDMDAEGGIEGAKERAKAFHAGDSEDKSALMNEIDRRYYAEAGMKPGTKIKKGEEGRAALWRTIRDEVLFQYEYIANLPPEVKKLIKLSTQGKELTPADYDKLFAIAKKIDRLPPGQVNEYASKVTGSTTDLHTFEASLDKYIAEAAKREKEGAERDTVKTKLLGLEEVYRNYQNYKTMLMTSSVSAIGGGYPGMGGGLGGAYASMKLREELEADLKRYGFASISEFEEYIKRFESAFETEAAHIANDLLGKYQGKLYRESQRYHERAEVQALHGQLSGVRTHYQAQQKHQKEVERLQQQRWMGAHQTHVPLKSQAQKDHEAKVEGHKQGTTLEVAKLAKANPIFNEEHLPSDKQIDKGKLSMADVDGLQALLLAHIAARVKDADDARNQIEGKPELIYKMDKLFPQFYARQGIRPGSIHDMIIQDKMKSDAIIKLVKGIALAVIAIALAVVSFGTATPAIVAAGAAIAGAGLGAYAAYEEYQEYTQEKDLADVGFANDPSVVWLVIAIAGAGLDMAAAVKAVSALGKAAKALDAGGELADFTKVVRELEKAGEIEAKIARAAENAAKARKGFAEASTELTKVMAGKLYSFPGPLADPDVYKAVVKMARQAIKTKAYDAQKFIEELKLARARAKMGDLTPEELVKAKQAWEEAKALEIAEQVSIAKYGESMSKLLARADLPNDLRSDIIEQVTKAMNNPAVDDDAIRTAIRTMRTADKPQNVREFLAELRHVNETAKAPDLAKGSKVFGGIKAKNTDGSLREFDLGGDVKVNIDPMSEADALYRSGGSVHLDEVKHTPAALKNKLREKPTQLENLKKWRNVDSNREVMVVVESEDGWTTLLGTPDVIKMLAQEKIPLQIGGKVFSPSELGAFHAKIFAKYKELVINGSMSPGDFMSLPDMKTLDRAAAFVGYP